jgi:hypothetical protein
MTAEEPLVFGSLSERASFGCLKSKAEVKSPKRAAARACRHRGCHFAGGCVVTVRAPAPGPAYYDVEVDVAPPPPRAVEVPPPRVGFVWAPGYWNWNGHEHVWAEGRWMPERAGYHWSPDRWEQHNGRWRLAKGHWERLTSRARDPIARQGGFWSLNGSSSRLPSAVLVKT